MANSMGTVRMGSRVELQFGEMREEWRIVDPSEADVVEHRMSTESALATAIIGRRIGDYCAVRAPGGTYGVTVLDVA
jgi:transcription elongation factor GreA